MNSAKKRSQSIWEQSFHRLMKNKLAVVSIIFLLFMVLFSFIGPLFSPYISDSVNVSMIKQPPSFKHLLGTDDYGRDVLTRLMLAGRISLTVGLASMFLSLILGTFLGAVSGFYGGIIGALLSELKVPTEYRLYIVMLMLSIVGWPSLARLVRGQILYLREQTYMKAVDVLGLSDRRKILHHLIPNTFPLLIVVATLSTASGILSESSLSFLGLGVVPPTPSWGNMISAANNLMDFQNRAWLWVPPGVAIFSTVVAINLLGDAIRDVLDPKMKGR